MSIDLAAHLVETAQKVSVTRNEDGDINYGASTDTLCLYRDISMLSLANNREDIRLDGILWFGPTEVVARGDVYYHPNEGYLQIVRINNARRRLLDNSLQFIKCGVIRQRQIS